LEAPIQRRRIAGEFLNRIDGSGRERARRTVRLLALFGRRGLASRGEQVRAAALDLDALVRAAARPLVTRLAPIDVAFRRAMFDAVLQTAFRTEPAEGLPRRAELAGDCLGAECDGLDSGTLWRLLQSKAKGGASRRNAFSCTRAASLSVRQIAGLARIRLRRYAMGARGVPGRRSAVRAEPADAVLLLDSEWTTCASRCLMLSRDGPADAFPAPAAGAEADSVDPSAGKRARPDAAHPRVGRNSRRS